MAVFGSYDALTTFARSCRTHVDVWDCGTLRGAFVGARLAFPAAQPVSGAAIAIVVQAIQPRMVHFISMHTFRRPSYQVGFTAYCLRIRPCGERD